MRTRGATTTRQMSFRRNPIALNTLKTASDWFEEPVLEFAGGQTHADVKVGIPLYGPRSLGTPRHKSEVHVGFIGTAEAVESARGFYERASAGLSGDSQLPPFPGCKADRGFRSDLRFNPATIEQITRQESQSILGTRGLRQRFESLLSTIEPKLKLLTEKDQPLDYVVFALSEELYEACKVADYREAGLQFHRDLRRAFKALAMKYGKATQILRESTAGVIQTPSRDLDHPSRIAWNLFTGLYFKADGLPWGPRGLPPGSCFVGVSFFRPLGNASALRTSVVQAFDENGEGLVLRGHDFHWNEQDQGRSPHLDADAAKRLVEMVIARYKDEHRRQAPQRVVLHKSSRFEPAEREGFEDALKGVGRYDLVSLSSVSDIRLIRAGTYPPLRGTHFGLGDESYLYTTGYSHILGSYPHGHVPSPLLVTDHVGDTPKAQLLSTTVL